MIKKMRILISNDDGIYSPGIVALARSCRVLAKYASWHLMSSNLPWVTRLLPRGHCDISGFISASLRLIG